MAMHTAMCRTQQRLREIQISKSVILPAKVIGACQQGDVFAQDRGNVRSGATVPELPEDMLRLMYPLLPVQDAARAACVSQEFLSSWRCYPNLIFNNQTIGLDKRWLGMDDKAIELDDTESYVVSRIDHILQNHSGTGVKVLKLELFACPNIKASHIDRWFQFIVKPGIEELVLEMSTRENKTEYIFPCSLLSNQAAGRTLKSLGLALCTFHPTVALGCNRSLSSLDLWSVNISGEELGVFLSNCLALERLKISSCNDIMCFKVPSPMQQLHHLEVTGCEMLKSIEINAQRLSTFVYGGTHIQISLQHAFEVNHIRLDGQTNMVSYARTVLPSIMPNVESLCVASLTEVISTPMLPSKFLRLKNLEIYFPRSRSVIHAYDFLSLTSFLEASPALETFILHVEQDNLRHDSILGDSDDNQSHLRRIMECRHDNLKDVKITGFSSAKSMIELTNHIIENTSSLESIILDTVCSFDKTLELFGICNYMSKKDLMEALKALEAIRRYIKGKVPSFVNLVVLEPCCKCHMGEQ